MALKVVNTESLDAVANAINAKSGTSGALQFPEGFVDAIGAIQAGGGEDLSTALTEQEELVAELKGLLALKAKLGDAKLPSVIDGTVTELTAEDLAGCTKIRDNAFNSMSSLASVELPESVLTIGKQSFYICGSLTNIKLNARVTQILDYAFYSCKLTNIVFPKTLTKIGVGAFYSCRLQYVDLTAYGTDSTFPTLDNKNAFANNTPSTFEIRVKSGRKAELAAMTNWSTYADNIVEV